MRLYHGSNVEVAAVDLSFSKVGKDFGCGFYLSANREQALELAKRKTEQTGEGNPVLNVFDFDEAAFRASGLALLEFSGYTREWAEFVLMNRRNRTRNAAHAYDVVVGPIADDAVGFQIRRFTAGLIDFERFLQELKYMKGITYQYFLGTDSALKYLKRMETL